VRTICLFNDNWLFAPQEWPPDAPDTRFERVTLPHSNVILPHHNFDVSEYAFISTYRKRFMLPEPRDGRRVYLDFDGAMIASTVTLNGHTFPEYRGGYTPFSFDVTDYLHDSEENVLNVRLDSTERADIPPFGYVVDYLTFGGIYRDVWLRYVEPTHIKRVFVRPQDVLSDSPRLEVDVTLLNQGPQPVDGRLYVRFEDAATSPVHAVALAAGEEKTITVTFEPGQAVELWSLDNPALYHVTAFLSDGTRALDEVRTRFGFREAEFRQDGGFYLNGERVKLIGLNRHQTYPYIGAAAPARLQRKDAEIVKFELGCNIVRTSHYPQSPYFLDRCDEIGLLVFEEIPGWQHIGDEDWQALVLRDVQAMIQRDWNHPSIILWGVRINESQDNEALYTQTNALAHQLDPTRQTGGVRYIMESQFLEDVFTFNDFSNSVREPVHTPQVQRAYVPHQVVGSGGTRR